MTSPISSEVVDGIAVIRLQSPPVNALSRDVRVALHDAIAQAADDMTVRGIVLAGDSRCFSAGADISEFRAGADAMFAGRDPAEVIALLEGLHKPVVAAIEAAALGGGLELALGCHARVAAKGATMGLPEIRLGVIPGAGGTQRLPRLVGLDAAMRMMLTGEPVNAQRALALGLIDSLVPSSAIAAAVSLANELSSSSDGLRRTRDLPIPSANGAREKDEEWRALSLKARAPQMATDQLLACADDAIELPFNEAMRAERARFVRCNSSDAAAGLQHAFFATREAARLNKQDAGAAELRVVQRVAVIGGGTMGRGIAMAMANGGFAVTIIETDDARAHGAIVAVREAYKTLSDAGRLDVISAEDRASRIAAVATFDSVRHADLVIEAVFENLEIKRDVCRRLGQACKPGAIIASNTSTLDIDLLARESRRPADFLGMHFFSPAHVMRLVEVVRGKYTDPGVLATAVLLVRGLGKDPVVSGVCYGFIGNRMLEPYLRETEALLLEGCTPARIDAAIEGYGMAMGPCRMMDLAGVDVVAKVVQEQDKLGRLPADPLYRIVCRAFADLGRFGQKTGAGFYTYEGRRAVEDTAAIAAVRELAARHRVRQRGDITDHEIVERCLLPLVNEGFLIVEEGIASRESDVDVVWLSGYGFPAQRGGPLFQARRTGLRDIAERLDHQAARSGDPYGYWKVAQTLRTAMHTKEIEST